MMVGASIYAQTGPIRTDGGTVIVNEVPVMLFKASYNGTPPELRASNVIQRLQKDTGAVAVQGGGDIRKIMRGSTLLAVITQDDASLAGQSLSSLASTWYSSLRDALTLPPLKLVQDSIRIPLSEQRTVRIVGSKAYAAEVLSSNPLMVTAKKTSDGILLNGVNLGQATITVTAPGASVPLTAEVWPYASNLPQTVTAQVTGLPANDDIVQGAIEAAIRTQTRTVQGANITFRVDGVSPISIGDSTAMDVKLHVEGPRSFAKDGVVHVNLKNLPIGKKAEGQLWYCNDPESLTKPGPLFAQQLLKDAPIRLLYHHENDTLTPLFVRIQLVNDSDTPARVVIMPGDAKPDKNPVLAGLLAADAFLRHWINNSGEVIFIGPHCSAPVSLHRLMPTETISGLCALRLIDGPDSVQLRADAIPPFEPDAKWTAAINSNAPWRYVGSDKMTFYDEQPTVATHHIYPVPYKTEDVAYQVGGRYGFVRIGQKPISNASQDGALEGNFGVVYTIKAKMTNPTNAPADVEVIFEASAGYAGALFVVDGQVKRTFPLAPKTTSQLALVHLDPGASKSLTLMTIPHSGGSYPATVTIRPVQDAVRFQSFSKGS